jgi:hypothetical protein
MQDIVVWWRPAVETGEDAREPGGSFIEPPFIRC